MEKISEKTKNKIFITIICLLMIVLSISAWLKFQPAPVHAYSKDVTQKSLIQSRVLIAGDVYWGRRMHDAAQKSDLKYEYPFSQLHKFDKGGYDAWIANLECPAIPDVKQPVGFVPELWEFNCDTDYMSEFAKWVEIVSLANNHTSNQNREQGQTTTRQELDKIGIQHFGGFNPHVVEDVCKVISLPARTSINGEQKSVSIPVAMCGYHGVYYTVTDESIDRIKRYADIMPVIAFPHAGEEYSTGPSDSLRELYRKMIDAGADAVIGNHPHVVQEAEVYNDKLIFYSMGNFIFDQQFSEGVMRSAAIDIEINIATDDLDEQQLLNWTNLVDCNSSECLDQYRSTNPSKISASLSYDIVGVDLSNMITRPASNRLRNQILETLKWSDVMNQGVVSKNGRVRLGKTTTTDQLTELKRVEWASRPSLQSN